MFIIRRAPQNNAALSPAFNKEVQARVALCKETVRSNCIGTALYIAGERAEDEYMNTTVAHGTILRHLRQLKRPVDGCLVAWQEKRSYCIDVLHMGVVVQLNPLLVAERQGYCGVFEEKSQFSDVCDFYFLSKHFFYLPKGLDGNVQESPIRS